MTNIYPYNYHLSSALASVEKMANGFINMHLDGFDIEEKSDVFVASLELPGYKKDNITIEITNDNNLTVEATKNSARHSVSRSLHLTDELDTSSISAKLEDGVLSITIPKVSKPAPRRIAITG